MDVLPFSGGKGRGEICSGGLFRKNWSLTLEYFGRIDLCLWTVEKTVSVHGPFRW
jgi:hypothetical protein